jgi:hypothetical protein
MLTALRSAGINDVLRALVTRYGLSTDALGWAEMPDGAGHNNNSRFACYRAARG